MAPDQTDASCQLNSLMYTALIAERDETTPQTGLVADGLGTVLFEIARFFFSASFIFI